MLCIRSFAVVALHVSFFIPRKTPSFNIPKAFSKMSHAKHSAAKPPRFSSASSTSHRPTHNLKQSNPHIALPSKTFLTSSLAVLMLFCFVIILLSALHIIPPTVFTTRNTLILLTLTFNNSYDEPLITHNCNLISQTSHQYIIYTDDISQPYCQKCACVRFIPDKCECPDPKAQVCNLCQKLRFLIRALDLYREIVFIDSDLIVVKPEMFDAMYARTKHFDFLAAYGFVKPSFNLYSNFNSGFMFMRKLPHLDYTHMETMMRERGYVNDQAVVSSFVQENYQHWDSLAMQWHCRFIYQKNMNIRPSDCYTFHGRGPELVRFLHDINLTIPIAQ